MTGTARPRLFDSHAHLLDERLKSADPLKGIDAALCVFQPGEDLNLFRNFLENEKVYGACGIHPHDAKHASSLTGVLKEALDHPKVAALGEIGLDYHWDNSPRPVQREVFCQQLGMADSLGLPVIIHSRSAFKETLEILDRHKPEKALIHCFSEGPGEAEEALRRGFYISIGGIVTFPNASALRESVRLVPSDRLLVETDAPYLAPRPLRGRTNMPAYVEHTLREVARIKDVSFETMAEAAFRNAAEFFNIEKWRNLK